MMGARFLTCDDLGPLGRLVAPGDFLVMDPPGESEPDEASSDLKVVLAERKWVGQQYAKADAEGERFRRALRTAHLGGEERREQVREGFEIWTIEASKFSLCDRWLLAVITKLESGKQMAMDVPADFSWEGFGPIRNMKDRLFAASDAEIVGGAWFRAQ